MNRAFDELTITYGELYNKYFERTAPFLNHLEGIFRSKVKNLENIVETLKARIFELEAKLK